MLALACSGCIRAFVRFAGRFLANKSHPARRARLKPSARKSTNASRPRRRGRTRFAVLHTHDLAAVVWPHTCRILTAIQWQTRRVTNRQSDDPGPCRCCAATFSRAADAPTYSTLGSHVKSGPRMRRSPRMAVPVSSKWRFAVGHGRHQPQSLAQR